MRIILSICLCALLGFGLAKPLIIRHVHHQKPQISDQLQIQTGITDIDLHTHATAPYYALPDCANLILSPNRERKQTLLTYLSMILKIPDEIYHWMPQRFTKALPEATFDDEQLAKAEDHAPPKPSEAIEIAESQKEMEAMDNERKRQEEKQAYVQRGLADAAKRARWLEEMSE